MEPTMDKKSNGALIGAVIVIIILVLGGVYLWQSNSLKDSDDSKPIPVNTEQQSYLEELNMASVIEADLNLLEEENNTADADFTADVEATQ